MSNQNRQTGTLFSLLQTGYSKYKQLKRNSALLLPFSLALLSFVVLSFLEHFLYLPSSLKTTWIIVSLAGLAVLAVLKFRGIEFEDFKSFYRNFGRKANIRELAYAIDLEENKSGDSALVEAAIRKNLEQSASTDTGLKLSEYLKTLPDYSGFRKLLMVLAISASFLMITLAAFPDAGFRAANFWSSFEKPNPFTFEILPGNIVLEQGSSFVASIKFKHDGTPNSLQLNYKTSVEEKFRKYNLENTDTAFTSLPITVGADASYFIEMDGFKSEMYKVQMQLRPRFEELLAEIIPPEYMKLEPVTTGYPFAQVNAYEGSRINLKGSVNKPLRSLAVRSDEEALTPVDSLRLADTSFAASFVVADSDTVSFEMTDENGLKNSNSFQFVVKMVKDEYPNVEIVEPSAPIEAVKPGIVSLIYRANDDFGFTRMRLVYEVQKAFVDAPVTNRIQLEIPQNNALQQYQWNTDELNLSPKDIVRFWLEVWDNDKTNGAKSSKSQELTISIPSLADYFEELSEDENEVENSLKEITESFEQAKEQYQEFREKLQNNPRDINERTRDIEALKQMQESMEQSVKELNEKFEEIKKELNENSLLSKETLQKYQELQKLMEELDDPALREALEKLQESLNRYSPEQLRQALEDTEFNEQVYQERLERTVELFKQLKLQSNLDKIAKAAKDLEERQNPQNTEEEMKGSLNDAEKLSNQLDEITKDSPKRNAGQVEQFQKDASKEIKEALEQLKEMLAEKLEQKNAENQNGGESGEQQQQQQQQNGEQNPQENEPSYRLKRKFQKVQEQANQLMASMQQEQFQVNIAALEYILYSLIEISETQEKISDNASNTENRSQAFVQYAREQSNVSQIFSILSDSLLALSAELPQFPNIINEKKLVVKRNLENSVNELAERDSRRASIVTRDVLAGVNDIAFMLLNLLDQQQDQANQMGGGQGSQSLMQMLQNMSEGQQQLNEQIQQMINDMQGERLSNEMQQRLDQMARQQNEIRKQIEDLQNSGEIEQGDRLSSELRRIAEQMEDTINDLRGGAADPLMIERQQNILSRMLDAEKSVQERGEKDEREGREGLRKAIPTPPELTLDQLEKEIRNRLKDPNFTKYSPDYQRLIERYFELLKQMRPGGS